MTKVILINFGQCFPLVTKKCLVLQTCTKYLGLGMGEDVGHIKWLFFNSLCLIITERSYGSR